MVSKAKEFGHKAVAITDHGTVAGWIDFLKECRKQNMKPILGMEGYLSRDHTCHSLDCQPDGRRGNRHINIIAKNLQGYKNLCTLSHTACLEGTYYDPRLDYELLDKYKDGLIVTSACLSNVINFALSADKYEEAKRAATMFKDIFGDDFYLEMMFHGIDKEAKILPEIQKLADEIGCKTIITNDCHYIKPEDAEFQKALMCMNGGKSIKDPKRIKFPYDEFYFKSTEQMQKVFPHCQQSMKNTLEIAEKCDYSDIVFIEEGGVMKLPDFKIPEGKKSKLDYMEELAWEGFHELGFSDSEVHKKRLEQEISDVRLIWETKRYDFATYFLIHADIMRFARENNIASGIRGSGYGSLLVRCLKISEGVDPVAQGLLWERFLGFDDLYFISEVDFGESDTEWKENNLNSMSAYLLGITSKKPDGDFWLNKRRTYARDGFPDIDMDFDREKRHLIVEYLIEKYGSDCVANIGTVQQLKIKNTVRRVIKVLDPENTLYWDEKGSLIKKEKGEVDELIILQNSVASTLPDLMKRADGSQVKNIEEAYNEYSQFRSYMDSYPEVYRYSKHLENSISAYGVHAAGIVMSPKTDPLHQIAPLHITRGTGSDKVVATQFPMSHVESLGLIKYDVLGLSTKTAISKACKQVKENHGVDINLSSLPLDDSKTLKLLSSGLTDGCFQLENPGMKETIKMIGIDSFDDLIVAIAMFRPGPKDYIPELSRRKKGTQQVSYPHPIMKSITERTYGIMAYQEQVMQAFMALASLPASDGYTFMKGCAKKQQDKIEKYKVKFLKNAKRNKIDDKVSAKIWSDMEKFGGYAFNQSHACSYAYESWKTAYLKAHYPAEFMAARLSVAAVERDFDNVKKYEDDCKRMGMKILKPDLNRSKLDYTIVEEKVLLRPLLIKGVGDKAAHDIIDNQPFIGDELIVEFAKKVGSAVNVKVVEALYEAGLFGKKKSKESLLKVFEAIKADRRKMKGRQNKDMFE